MQNAFESAERKVIPAVLIYVQKTIREKPHTLMLHRVIKKNDYHEGKWNGLGGKFEKDESPQQAAARELREESGLQISEDRFESVGVLQFPNFKAHKNEDWMVFVFLVQLDTADFFDPSKAQCPEGKLEWIANDALLNLNLWEGDKHFLPHVIARKPFLGTFWYEGQNLARHQLRQFGPN